MSTSRNFIFDTLKYIPIKVMPAFAGILTVFFLTKKSLLNVPSYVDYTYIIALLLIFGQIIGGWVNSSVIFYYTSYENVKDKENFTLNISYLQLTFLVIGSAALFIIIFFTLHSFVISLLIIFILFFQIFLNFNYSFFQAQRNIRRQIVSTFIQSTLQIVGLIICYYFFKGSIDAVLFFMLTSYMCTAGYLMVAKKNVMHFKFDNSFDTVFCKKILEYGFPVCLWFFSTQVYQIGDRVLFKYFNLTADVGNYVSFRDLSVGLSGFVAMPLLFASHPIIIQLSKNEDNKLTIEKLLRRNIVILTIIFMPIIVIAYLYGEFLIKYIVSEKYLLSPVLMVVVLSTILLGIISIYLQKGIEAKGNTFLMLKISMFVAIFSVILNFIFIKEYGVVASIYISLICHILYCVCIYFYSRRIFKIFI